MLTLAVTVFVSLLYCSVEETVIISDELITHLNS